MKKQLYRSRTNKAIAGICGGIAERYDFDPTIVRIIVVLFALFTGGIVVLAYLLSWLIIPKETHEHAKVKLARELSEDNQDNMH